MTSRSNRLLGPDTRPCVQKRVIVTPANNMVFEKQHSTEYADIKLIDHVSKEMEAGKTPTSVYIDLLKAFEVLLYKLKYYGSVANSHVYGVMA